MNKFSIIHYICLMFVDVFIHGLEPPYINKKYLTETAVISAGPCTVINPFRAASWARSSTVFAASSSVTCLGSLSCMPFETSSPHKNAEVDKPTQPIFLLATIADLANTVPWLFNNRV